MKHTREQHIRSLEENGPGGAAFEQSKAILEHQNAEALVSAIDKLDVTVKQASASSDRLGRRVLWLNVVIAAATVVGGIATAVHAYVSLFKN